MRSREEELLRAAFGELRAVERTHAPAMRVAARMPRATFAMAVRGFAAAILALFVILTCARLIPAAKAPMPTSYVDVTSWKAPTDFLLETPQNEMLKTVPQFGERNVLR